MRLYRAHIAFLVIGLLCCNSGTFSLVAEDIGLHNFGSATYNYQLASAAMWVLDAWLVVIMLLLIIKKQPIPVIFKVMTLPWVLTSIGGIMVMLAINPILAGRWTLINLLLPLGNLLLVAKTFHQGFVREGRSAFQLKIRPWATALFGLIAVFFLLECCFIFVAKSNLNDNALASKVWFQRYWDVNSLGYRESEELVAPDTTKRQLLLVGDSFLAGHGIKNPADRFSDRLQLSLGDPWEIHNHGENGAATNDELAQILKFESNPDLVVLCWFLNDIQSAAQIHGLKTGNSPKTPFPISVQHGSYLVNYLFGLFPDQAAGENYLTFLERAYSMPEVMEPYQRELNYLATASRDKGAKFAVVLFPMMNFVAGSEFALGPMRSFWAKEGVPCLDLATTFLTHDSKELVVNGSDSHPNEFAHSLAADAILAFLQQNHLLDTDD